MVKMDFFNKTPRESTKMATLTVLTLLAQNGWVRDILPAWTTCRELFYDETFTERMETFFEDDIEAESDHYMHTQYLAHHEECCDDIVITGSCYCRDIAAWHHDDHMNAYRSFQNLLYTRDEFFPYPR